MSALKRLFSSGFVDKKEKQQQLQRERMELEREMQLKRNELKELKKDEKQRKLKEKRKPVERNRKTEKEKEGQELIQWTRSTLEDLWSFGRAEMEKLEREQKLKNRNSHFMQKVRRDADRGRRYLVEDTEEPQTGQLGLLNNIQSYFQAQMKRLKEQRTADFGKNTRMFDDILDDLNRIKKSAAELENNGGVSEDVQLTGEVFQSKRCRWTSVQSGQKEQQLKRELEMLKESNTELERVLFHQNMHEKKWMERLNLNEREVDSERDIKKRKERLAAPDRSREEKEDRTLKELRRNLKLEEEKLKEVQRKREEQKKELERRMMRTDRRMETERDLVLRRKHKTVNEQTKQTSLRRKETEVEERPNLRKETEEDKKRKMREKRETKKEKRKTVWESDIEIEVEKEKEEKDEVRRKRRGMEEVKKREIKKKKQKTLEEEKEREKMVEKRSKTRKVEKIIKEKKERNIMKEERKETEENKKRKMKKKRENEMRRKRQRCKEVHREAVEREENREGPTLKEILSKMKEQNMKQELERTRVVKTKRVEQTAVNASKNGPVLIQVKPRHPIGDFDEDAKTTGTHRSPKSGEEATTKNTVPSVSKENHGLEKEDRPKTTTARLMGWVSKKVKKHYEKKIEESLKTEKEMGHMWCIKRGKMYLVSKYEPEKRERLKKREQKWQALEARWMEWERKKEEKRAEK